MKQIQTLILILLSVTSTVSFSQSTEKLDCSVLKNCKLRYFEADDVATYITIKDNDFWEYPDGGKAYIKSKLDWVSDCEYNATVTEFTVSDAPFKVGDTMHVKFDKIDHHIVYYTATFKGQTLSGQFKISN